MKITKAITLTLICFLGLSLNSCKTSSGIQKTSQSSQNSSAEAYMKKVVANSQTQKAVTAKLKLDIIFGDKNISLSGNLKMKRDEVIQLSVNFLGMEVGRMEFSNDNVLIIDRFNKQYVKVPYSKVGFLSEANLDFNALQSLFWSELFEPGNSGTPVLAHFSLSESGACTLLSLKSAPKLDYSFLTTTATALIDRTMVQSKNIADKSQLEWKYGNYVNLGGKKFPQQMNISMKGLSKSYQLGITISSLSNSSDWETHTVPSSKYKQKSADDIMRQLMSL